MGPLVATKTISIHHNRNNNNNTASKPDTAYKEIQSSP
jgi:hypothetical protein